MKTRELVRLIQEADPSGELETCVENVDILEVTVEPAYYDGSLQVLRRSGDERGYDVIGADYVRTGQKVVINTYSISEAIYMDENIPIGFIGCGQKYIEESNSHLEEIRKQSRQVKLDVEWSLFTQWAEKRVKDLPGYDSLFDNTIETALIFAREQIRPDDPMPKDIGVLGRPTPGKAGRSWFERRCLQWDREIELTLNDGVLTLRRRVANGEGVG